MSKEIKIENADQNDWENKLDEDWDDWGDAEDNSSEVVEAKKTDIKVSQKSQEQQSSTTIQDRKIEQKTTHESSQAVINASSWWGGFTSVLSTATEGLGNITSTVSQGLNQVIGVPDPEEMARFNAAEAAKVNTKETAAERTSAHNERSEDSENAAAFGKTIVSGVTTLGSKVLFTGLDTLEGIGKKTMNILQENDPLLKNKRKILGLEPEKPNLSEVLKEAKTNAEEYENSLKALKISQYQQELGFERLFENKCGLVHLEALEILSKGSELKLQKLIDSVCGVALRDLQETINEVKELMELEELDVSSEGDYTAAELNENLKTATTDLDLNLQFDDIVNNWQNTLDWLTTQTEADAQKIYEEGINRLAESCALAMNKLHKIAELLLVKEHHSTASEVDSIVQLCHQFNLHLHGVTHCFAAKLAELNTEEATTKLNTLCAGGAFGTGGKGGAGKTGGEGTIIGTGAGGGGAGGAGAGGCATGSLRTTALKPLCGSAT